MSSSRAEGTRSGWPQGVYLREHKEGGHFAFDSFSVPGENEHTLTIMIVIVLNINVVYFHNLVLYF